MICISYKDLFHRCCGGDRGKGSGGRDSSLLNSSVDDAVVEMEDGGVTAPLLGNDATTMNAAATAATPTITNTKTGRSNNAFPGMRRTAIGGGHRTDETNHRHHPTVLVATGGNALQAITLPNDVVGGGNQKMNLMSVSVPENVSAGDTILVQTPAAAAAATTPNGPASDSETPTSTPQFVEVAVPPGVYPGHSFLVEIPIASSATATATATPFATAVLDTLPPKPGTTATSPPPVLPALPVASAVSPPPGNTKWTTSLASASVSTTNNNSSNNNSSHNIGVNADDGFASQFQSHLMQQQRQQQQQQQQRQPATLPPALPAPDTLATNGLLLLQVPPGMAPGATIRHRLADGRTIEATVPHDPTVTQFYVRVPPPLSPPPVPPRPSQWN